MKKYYLVYNDGFVFVHDNSRWDHILMEIEAGSFVEAQSKIRFQMTAQGQTTTMHMAGGKVTAETI